MRPPPSHLRWLLLTQPRKTPSEGSAPAALRRGAAAPPTSLWHSTALPTPAIGVHAFTRTYLVLLSGNVAVLENPASSLLWLGPAPGSATMPCIPLRWLHASMDLTTAKVGSSSRTCRASNPWLPRARALRARMWSLLADALLRVRS